MTRGHCHDWFRKWKKEHNFCGLRPQDAKEMDQYIEISEKIAHASGKDEDFVHDHFTAGAARPLLRCKDENATTKALNYVVACIKREEDITGGDLQTTIDGFSGKRARKPSGSTQMRTPEPAKEPDRIVDANKPILSLAAQQAAKDNPCGEACPDCPDQCKPITCDDLKKAITDTTGKVSVKGDSNLDPRMAPIIQSAIEESGERRSTVVPAGAPYRESDPKYKPSPFQTAAQLMAHDKDPLEVGKMFQQAAVKDILITQPKTEKEMFLDACQSAYEHGKSDFKLAIDELMRYHPSWKDAGTVIYFCVTDPKEAIVKKK
jgi:hypothetical protein